VEPQHSHAIPDTNTQILPKTTQKHQQTVLGIILGGGAGSRLYPLTKKRAKPAVPLGANYRLIDIPVSNCVNSNVTKIYCLTQFNSASLNRHLSQAYVRRFFLCLSLFLSLSFLCACCVCCVCVCVCARASCGLSY
jgi:hypothetical protein